MARYCDIYEWKNDQGESCGIIGTDFSKSAPADARHGRWRMKPRGFWGWLTGVYDFDPTVAIEWDETPSPTTEKFQTAGGRWYGYGACEFCRRISVLRLNALSLNLSLCSACEDHFTIEGGYPNGRLARIPQRTSSEHCSVCSEANEPSDGAA